MAISRGVALGTLASVLLVASTASATTEVPAQGDARSVALGGTGTAYLYTAAAVFLNPAALDGVEKFSHRRLFADVGQHDRALSTESIEDQRDRHRAVLSWWEARSASTRASRSGCRAYPTSASERPTKRSPGTRRERRDRRPRGLAAVSFRLLDNLAIGLSYRIQLQQRGLQSALSDSGCPARHSRPRRDEAVRAELRGPVGGALLQAHADVELGFDYRSKTTSKLSGTSTLSVPAIAGMPASSQSFDATASYSTPHSFRVGSAFTFLDKRLLIAADAKLLLYQDSNRDLTVELKTPAGTQSQVQPQNWRNVVGGAFGVEYLVADIVPLRVGYSITSSATPPATACPFGIAPALVHAIHAGAGVRLRRVNFDAGGFYGFESVDLPNANPAAGGPVPGHYSGRFIMAALSVTYHS